MKLKRKIAKDEFDTLKPELQALYIEKDGSYVLDIDDNAFEALKGEKKELQEKLAKFEEEQARKIKEAEERAEKRAKEAYEKAKTDKDVEAIEKSWQDKYAKLEAEKTATDNKYSEFVKKSLIENEVNRISNEISTSPALLAPHIRSRLDVDFSGEEPKLIVLDDKGQRSALTVAELQKSFIDNADFSAIIKATSAKGGAGTKNIPNSGANQGDKKLSELSDQELADYYANQNRSE